MFKDDIVSRWAECDTEDACELLAKPWVRVFDMSDKVLQLLKLRHLEFIVTRCYMKQVAASAYTGEAASRGESSGSGSACAGLQELLDGCGLGGSYAAALAWCEKQGYDSVAEIVETGEQGVLVEALQLKPGKAKLLLGRIRPRGLL